ncbi:MAG: UvrD-helicase domain-containing protein, partial [Gemmataceae bacterium]
MTAPTEQQLRAITAAGVSVVLASGAGCGKTTVLTQRYLHYLTERGAKVPELVALTFTDRAAREMRSRIRAALQSRFVAAIEAGADLALWEQHLRELEAAPIHTFHSFCGRLVRDHAAALGLSEEFVQLDENLAQGLREEAIRRCFFRWLPDDSSLAHDLHELIVLYGGRGVRQMVRQLLSEVDRPAWETWLQRSPMEIVDDWMGPGLRPLQERWLQHQLQHRVPIARVLRVART